jgi:hypothetical protein
MKMRLPGVLQRSARQSHALTFLKEQWRSRIRMRHALLMEVGKHERLRWIIIFHPNDAIMSHKLS